LGARVAVDLAGSVCRLMVARIVLGAALIHWNICPGSCQYRRVTIIN
jgi:hypothetical protein